MTSCLDDIMTWLACLLELRDDHFLCGVVNDFLRAVFRQATCVRVIIAKYRGPEFFMALGQCFNHSSKSHMGSLSPPSVHHICWGWTSGFISQAALPGFGWIFSEATRSISTPLVLGGMLIDRRIIPGIKFAATMTWTEREDWYC